jgi:hypothetical protein
MPSWSRWAISARMVCSWAAVAASISSQSTPNQPPLVRRGARRGSQNPITRTGLNDDLPSASPQPPAAGHRASQQITGPLGIHHMHMRTPPTRLLGSNELPAVTAFRIDHSLACQITMDEQRHRRCPVIAPLSTFARRPLSALILRHPGAIDQHLAGEGDRMPPQRGDSPVAPAEPVGFRNSAGFAEQRPLMRNTRGTVRRHRAADSRWPVPFSVCP